MSVAVNLDLDQRSQQLSFVDKVSVIHKATSDDERTTPSYLFKEINDISFESIGYSESLAQFLLDRLRSKSCNVKLKVLKVMKHVMEHGSKEFQLALRASVDSIKEYSKFSGPSHPLHGNMPYLMIRNVAKDLCEKLYDLDILNVEDLHDHLSHSKDTKYGGLGPSRSGGAIQGFGNLSMIQHKGLGETILEGIEKLGNKMTVMPADRQSALLDKLNLSGASSNYQPPVIMYVQELSPVSLAKSSKTPIISKPVTRHVPGKAGGGWNDDDDDDDEEETGNIQRIVYFETESRDKVSCKSFETDSLADNDNQECAQTDLLQETKLVDDYLLKDSVSIGKQPLFMPFSVVQDFILKCHCVSYDCIVRLLSQRLLCVNTQLVARALQAIEGFIYMYHEEDWVSLDLLTVVCKAPLVHCFHSFGPTQMQANDDHATTRENKIWRQLQMKSIKIILILQQLSSHKDILSHSEISKFFPDHYKAEQTA